MSVSRRTEQINKWVVFGTSGADYESASVVSFIRKSKVMLRKLQETHTVYRTCKAKHTVYLWVHYLNRFVFHFLCKMSK